MRYALERPNLFFGPCKIQAEGEGLASISADRLEPHHDSIPSAGWASRPTPWDCLFFLASICDLPRDFDQSPG